MCCLLCVNLDYYVKDSNLEVRIFLADAAEFFVRKLKPMLLAMLQLCSCCVHMKEWVSISISMGTRVGHVAASVSSRQNLRPPARILLPAFLDAAYPLFSV